ncbi:TlpA family protein disulfide reductase [bacterium LRH843]|nr:TlpA family protein disulfide reductase [bacterium LRH843]
MIKQHVLHRIVLITLLCGVGWMYTHFSSMFQMVEAMAAPKQGVQAGQEAYPIELTTLQGKQVSLAENKGKPVVLNFFATWCHPCQEEMPVIVEMEKKLREKDAAFLAINLTSEEQKNSKPVLRQFLKHYRAHFDPLLDEQGDVMKKYQIIGIPTTIIIDEQGIVVQRINGGLSHGMMEEIVDNIKK